MESIAVLKTFFELFDSELERILKKRRRGPVVPEDRKRFGLRLRELRKRAKLSRDEIASALNKSPVMVVYYENGVVIPPDDYVRYVAEKAGLSEKEIEHLINEVTLLRRTRFMRGRRR